MAKPIEATLWIAEVTGADYCAYWVERRPIARRWPSRIYEFEQEIRIERLAEI